MLTSVISLGLICSTVNLSCFCQIKFQYVLLLNLLFQCYNECCILPFKAIYIILSPVYLLVKLQFIMKLLNFSPAFHSFSGCNNFTTPITPFYFLQSDCRQYRSNVFSQCLMCQSLCSGFCKSFLTHCCLFVS